MNTNIDAVEVPLCIKVFCAENHYKHPKMLKDGRIAVVCRMNFTSAILVMSPLTMDLGYEDRWCYETNADALAALNAWDGEGEPQGWHRHPGTGRRRENGDPLTEYINP